MATVPQAVTDAVSAAMDTSYTQGKADQALTDAGALSAAQGAITDLEAQVATLQAELDALENPPSPPPPPASAVFGASLGEPLAVAQALDAVRLYSPSKVAGLPAGAKVVVLSDKSTSPTATVNAVKANPGLQFYCTFHHEPDDDIKGGGLTPASWASTMSAYGHALAGLPNVHFGPIHNGSYGKGAWDTDSAACDKSLWTFWGMDRYCFGYEDPATQYAEGVAYAKSLGLPVLIGETAAPAADAAKQQTVATKARAWSLDAANNVAVVCWWQSTDSTHGDLGFANAAVQHAFLG